MLFPYSRERACIDPLRLAEYDRMLRIAEHYGERIQTANVKAHSLSALLREYPSHEFCIDLTEARELFNNIAAPTAELERLGLGQVLRSGRIS